MLAVIEPNGVTLTVPCGEHFCATCGKSIYWGQLIPQSFSVPCPCGVVNVFEGSIQPLRAEMRPAHGDPVPRCNGYTESGVAGSRAVRLSGLPRTVRI